MDSISQTSGFYESVREFLVLVVFTGLFIAILYAVYMRYIQPLKLKISYSVQGSLLIRYHSINTASIFLTLMVLFVMGVEIFRGIARKDLGVLPHIGVLSVCLFIPLILLLMDKTTLSVDTSGKIRVTSTPFSNLRSRKTITGIKTIYEGQTIINPRSLPIYRYPIWVKNQLGEEVMLFNQIDSEADAIKVVEKLREYLSLSGPNS